MAFDIDSVQKGVAAGDLAATILAFEKTTPLNKSEQVELALELARDLRAEGRSIEAQRVLRAALAIADAADPLLIARILDALTELLVDAGELDEAVKAAAKAHALVSEIGDPQSQGRRRRLAVLADLARRSGKSDLAASAESALNAGDAAPPVERLRRSADTQTHASSAPGYDLRVVHYATHRARTGSDDPYDFYTSARAPLSFGYAHVSVPKNRAIGSFNPPSGIVARRADQTRYIVVERVAQAVDGAAFYAHLGDCVAASVQKEALIFIHGYRHTFADALARAAQLATDLEIDGATLLYSWPSKGSILSYIRDRNEKIDPFIEDLKTLIVETVARSGAQRVHIVGHSMGAAFLLDALFQAQADPAVKGPLAQEVVFASPDIDADHFVGRVPRVRHLAQRVTVYTSEKDRALELSEVINGAPRAGRNAQRIARACVDCIETADANEDFIGHANFADSAIDDVRAVVWPHKPIPPSQRAVLSETGGVWRFRHEEPRDRDGPFREALVWMRRLGLEPALSHAENSKLIGMEPEAARRERLDRILNMLKTWYE